MSRRFLQSADLGALSNSAPDLAQVFVSLCSDIALVIDANGMVLDVAQDAQRPVMNPAITWIGRPWAETVTPETRAKIAHLLCDADRPERARRREVNHALGTDGEVPVSYAALRLGRGGPVLAVGRDLRLTAGMQQRFLQAQQGLERHYWQDRQLASRSLLLLHVATDAILAVDPSSLQVRHVNAAAARLWLGLPEPYPGTLEGQTVDRLFDTRAGALVRQAMIRAGALHRPAEIPVRLAGSHITVSLQVQALAGGTGNVLLRARRTDPLIGIRPSLDKAMHRLLEGTHDAVLVTDLQGRIVASNRAFAQMTATQDETQLLAVPLQNFLRADFNGCNCHRNGNRNGNCNRASKDAQAASVDTIATATTTGQAGLAALLKAAREHGLALARAMQVAAQDASPSEPRQWVSVSVTRLFEAGQDALGWVLRSQGEPERDALEVEVEVGHGLNAFPRER